MQYACTVHIWEVTAVWFVQHRNLNNNIFLSVCMYVYAHQNTNTYKWCVHVYIRIQIKHRDFVIAKRPSNMSANFFKLQENTERL